MDEIPAFLLAQLSVSSIPQIEGKANLMTFATNPAVKQARDYQPLLA